MRLYPLALEPGFHWNNTALEISDALFDEYQYYQSFKSFKLQAFRSEIGNKYHHTMATGNYFDPT